MKFQFRRLIAIATFISLTIISLGGVLEDYKADISRLEKQYKENLDKEYSTAGMVSASQNYYKELDKILNKCYKELMETLDEEGKIALRDSQREWIKFRDKEIDFAVNLYSKKDGTIWRLSPPRIMINLVTNRIKELSLYLSDQKDLL